MSSIPIIKVQAIKARILFFLSLSLCLLIAPLPIHSLSMSMPSPKKSLPSPSSTPSPSPSPSSPLFQNVRIELFFRNTNDLRERIRFLSSRGIKSFNVVNKSNKDDLRHIADVIQQEASAVSESESRSGLGLGSGSNSYDDAGLSICLHYSLKYNKCRKKDGAFHMLSDFVDDMSGTTTSNHDDNEDKDGREDHKNSQVMASTANGDGNGNGSNVGSKNEILLITGSGPKGKLDSLIALQRLSQSNSKSKSKRQTKISDSLTKCTRTSKTCTSTMTMAVAFNPFFPSSIDCETEQNRLLQKVATGQVDKIYLQFGTDLERLRSSLEWLTNTVVAEHCKDGKKIEICGSIFLPTKKLIAQQKFRPWNGVYLSDEFLHSEQSARGIVLHMMKVYQEYGCEILIEAPGVRSEKDLMLVEDLLMERNRDRGGNENRDRDIQVEKIADVTISNDNSNEMKVGTTLSTSTSSPKRRRIEKSLFQPSPLVPKQGFQKPAIVLFGTHDVRLHDNLAFQAASFHSSIIPVFIWNKRQRNDQEANRDWGVRGASEVVLKDALIHLEKRLEQFGLRLICRMAEDGDPTSSIGELCKLCEECHVKPSAVYVNKEHTTESRVREGKQREALEQRGICFIEHQSSLLYDPMDLSLKGGFHGGHWGTLMPFLRGCKKQLGEPRKPMQRFQTLALLESIKSTNNSNKKDRPEEESSCWPDGVRVEDLDLAVIKGKDQWDEPIRKRFSMSEDDALSTLNSFFQEGFHKYEKERSRADLEWSTSKLSAHLRIGTLSPNELYHKVEDSDLDYEDKKTFSRRLFWRDLAYFQLLSFPNMRECSIRTHYDETEWVTGAEEKKRLEAWKTGSTGYPLVDAGMRELYATGWMTQSIRMVTASFLTEYLRVDWVKGCEWFHYTLVDADSAINPMMWQNAGRSGIDQWNFVMSPVAASQDGTGAYTKKWVPELSKLKKPILHKPWEASKEILEGAGVILGETYPHRIITDLKAEKELSDSNVLAMRRKNQQFNNDRGYDLIEVGGEQTVVFTKKQFRIDREGDILKGGPKKKNKNKDAGSKTKRGVRGRARRSASTRS